ncbi:MAG: SOS response-associated peptidase family protein [Pseudobdellovibrio sp.]
MCAQFTLKIKANELSIKYGIKIPELLIDINEIFRPYKNSPVIVNDSGLKLVSMNFSLVPHWSKEPKVKFATHNARIETIIEKPTWKIPFIRHHCFVPLTGFYESVYEGPAAGHIIQFSRPQKELLFAAAIFDVWKSPDGNSKSLFSFSILTSEPTKFILDHGHDRSPIFLSFEDAKSWAVMSDEPKRLVQFLLDQNQKPNLTVQIDRPLKAGWEKRK